jgi:hypothetical protein
MRISRNIRSVKILRPHDGIAGDRSNKANLDLGVASETGSLVPRFESGRIEGSGFTSYFGPGIILEVVVGDTLAAALASQYGRLALAWGLHSAAGLVMMICIFVEKSVMLVWFPLHDIYFAAGLIQTVFAVLAFGAWPAPLSAALSHHFGSVVPEVLAKCLCRHNRTRSRPQSRRGFPCGRTGKVEFQLRACSREYLKCCPIISGHPTLLPGRQMLKARVLTTCGMKLKCRSA